MALPPNLRLLDLQHNALRSIGSSGISGISGSSGGPGGPGGPGGLAPLRALRTLRLSRNLLGASELPQLAEEIGNLEVIR